MEHSSGSCELSVNINITKKKLMIALAEIPQVVDRSASIRVALG